MKYKMILFLTLFFSATSSVVSQNYDFLQFMPLRIGNVWVYSCQIGYPYYSSGRIRIGIDSIVFLNNEFYFRYSFMLQYISGNNECDCCAFPFSNAPWKYVRVDSVSSRLSKYISTASCYYHANEEVFDSLKAKLNDSMKTCQNGIFRCIDTSAVTIFGLTRRARTFAELRFEGITTRKYASGIGLFYVSFQQLNTSSTQQLRGCVIDDVLYGDTSMLVGMIRIGSEVPEVFHLDQNYPNPFNSSTVINFEIPRSTRVEIVLFDVVGQKVQTLVNDELNSGRYNLTLNSDNLASGVYFYTMFADGKIIETKTMALIK